MRPAGWDSYEMSEVFVPVDREQSFLMAFDFRELLGEDHLVWTVIGVVDSLDLSPLYARYGDHPEGGRPAFDPKMMLALLVYGYANGLRSSRALETACRLDFAYRAITANRQPDHATIARFRASLDAELAPLFAQVLGICAELGMGKVGLVAVDGTRLEAAASKASNRTQGQLQALQAQAREMLAEAAAADAADLHSPPPAPLSAAERLERIAAAQARLQERTSPPPRNRGGWEPTVNLTDPDSRVMKRAEGGFLQGYNAQAVVSADQLVIAASVSNQPTDVGLLGPLLEAAVANLEAAGSPQRIGTALADAGYWSEANSTLDLGIDLLIATTKSHRVGQTLDRGKGKPGPPTPQEWTERRRPIIEAAVAGRLTLKEAAAQLGLSYTWTWQLVTNYRRRGNSALALSRQPTGAGPGPRPPSSATLARRAMETKLAQNLERYRQRAWMIEGVFAHTKWHRGYRRFSRRGLTAVDAEWKLIHLAGNIRKAHRFTSRPLSPTFPSPSPGCRPRLSPHPLGPVGHRSFRCRLRRSS